MISNPDKNHGLGMFHWQRIGLSISKCFLTT
uniref:Uncharacterized protein n=1 Tax=Anguilla anguilla TaxID=7936 RepID=A0A0E9SZT5_ANGAN